MRDGGDAAPGQGHRAPAGGGRAAPQPRPGRPLPGGRRRQRARRAGNPGGRVRPGRNPPLPRRPDAAARGGRGGPSLRRSRLVLLLAGLLVLGLAAGGAYAYLTVTRAKESLQLAREELKQAQQVLAVPTPVPTRPGETPVAR